MPGSTTSYLCQKVGHLWTRYCFGAKNWRQTTDTTFLWDSTMLLGRSTVTWSIPASATNSGSYYSYFDSIIFQIIISKESFAQLVIGLLTGEWCVIIVVAFQHAGVAELADALDSKSSSLHGECGFDSLLRHSCYLWKFSFYQTFLPHISGEIYESFDKSGI